MRKIFLKRQEFFTEKTKKGKPLVRVITETRQRNK